jgi:4-hydroxybenzoate polyprenyltransferase
MELLPKVLAYIQIIRIKDWFYITGIAYLGFFSHSTSFAITDFVYLSLIAILYNAHGYSLNNYFDFQIDQPTSETMMYRDINSKAVLIISIACCLLSIGLALYYSYSIAILVVLGIIISFSYSSRFTRLKKIPVWNIILNSSGFTILFLMGYLANKPFSTTALYLSIYIWIGIIPSQLIHLVAHSDSENNWLTPPRFSIALIYISLLSWLLWALFSFTIYLKAGSILMATLIFCIFQVVIIECFKQREGLLASNFRIIRKILKWANIVFGGTLIYFLSSV